MKATLTLLIICLFFFQLKSQVLNVPSDYPSIQYAIDSSNNGDTIIVAEGIYMENIILNNKNIVLSSMFIETLDNQSVINTIIDGDHNGCVIDIENGVMETTKIIGFTIINGTGKPIYVEDQGDIVDTTYKGGGIYIGDSCSPILDHLILKNNTAICGGGIAVQNGSVKIENCKIVNNSSISVGGGIFLNAYYKGFDIISSVISENFSSLGGGGIYITSGFYEKRLYVKDTEISKNASSIIGQYGYQSGGALRAGNTHVIFENVTMFDNHGYTDFCMANYYLEIHNSIIWNTKLSLYNQHGDSIPTLIEYSDVENEQNNFIFSGYHTIVWGNGNINIYPEFVDTISNNFTLSATSPCIDSGNPDTAFNDSDGSRNDIGAYEYHPSDYIFETPISAFFNVFPNPANETIMIGIEEDVILEIINVQGKIVDTKSLTEKTNNIDISNLISGVYTLRIKTDRGIAIKKLIKQ